MKNLEASSLGFLMQKFLFRTNLRLDILYCDEALILKSLEVWNSKRGIKIKRETEFAWIQSSANDRRQESNGGQKKECEIQNFFLLTYLIK